MFAKIYSTTMEVEKDYLLGQKSKVVMDYSGKSTML